MKTYAEMLLEIDRLRQKLITQHEREKTLESAIRERLIDEVISLFRVNAPSLGIKKRDFKRYEEHIRKMCGEKVNAAVATMLHSAETFH